MSADLVIRVMEGITEEEVRQFLGGILGSKHFNWNAVTNPGRFDLIVKACSTPGVWVGQVSWLKAALLEGGEETYIPGTVGAVSEIIGEDLPIIDAELIQRVADAFNLPNSTAYSLAEKDEVVAFLQDHIGQRIYTVSE